MKNENRLGSLMEELSCEPRSPDYDSALSSMLQIDSKAREIAKGYGVPVGQIYKAIDFNPKGFVSEFGANQEGLEFSHSDVMRDLQVLEKQIVSKEDRQYGGIGLPEFLDNEDALFGYFEKPKPACGWCPNSYNGGTSANGGTCYGASVLASKCGFFSILA